MSQPSAIEHDSPPSTTGGVHIQPPPPSHSSTQSAPKLQLQNTRSPPLKGRYLHLQPLTFSELPWHPSFATANDPLDLPGSTESDHISLSDFITSVVSDAKHERWDVMKWHKTGVHKFKKGAAKGVQVEQFRKVERVTGDAWFARLSRHTDESSKTWESFEKVLGGGGDEEGQGMKSKSRGQKEMEFTPSIWACNDVLDWNEGLRDVKTKEEVDAAGLRDVTLRLANMYHSIPGPLTDRVFSVLVLTGIRTNLAPLDDGTKKDEFLVIQLPVDLATFPKCILRMCCHLPDEMKYLPGSNANGSGDEHNAGKKLTRGKYVSIEKVTRMKGENWWSMATASDAGGVLPMWVQKMAVPGEIVKDVEFVYQYMEDNEGQLGSA